DGNTSTKSIVVVLYSAITIHYQDDSGNKIKDDLILSGNPGDTYTVDNTDVIFNNKNYYFISSDPSSLTGNYGSQGQPSEITLTYKDNKQSINGSDFTMTLGDKEPTVSDFKASATDKAGNTLDVTADLTKVDFTKVGTYDVVLTTTDGQSKTVKLTIKENKQSISGSNFTMTLGD
ncbi:hypothetical protein COK47_31765, partial [Bacillus cereus]|uniref:MucBP domain-containing protein n=1 Tax=Bacillus cereus TaxID=1396 RepID=UPI000C01F282